MPLPEDLQGDRWREKAARAAIPILIRRAKDRVPITYGELDREIVRHGKGKFHHVHAAAYGGPAGRIGDALIETGRIWGVPIPPLNSLIVNGQTRLPGHGCDWYLQKVLGRPVRNLSEQEKPKVVEKVHEKVYRFADWNKLLREYEMKPLVPRLKAAKKRPGRTRRRGWSSEGESEEHKDLCKYVAAHPAAVGLTRAFGRGNLKYRLLSGDKPDVWFARRGRVVPVEVKSSVSNDDDIERGIYQCIKYRAVAEAEQVSYRQVPNATAVLAVGRQMPHLLADLANVHDVPFCEVKAIGSRER